MCPNYILEIKKHEIAFIALSRGTWVKIEIVMSVKLLVIVNIVFKRYSSTYCLMQGSCFICSDF